MSEIKGKELIVALPHGLKGHVMQRETSDAAYSQWRQLEGKEASRAGEAEDEDKSVRHKRTNHTGKGKDADELVPGELFRLGQLVRCCVTKLSGSGHEDLGSKAASQKRSEKQRKRIDLTLRVAKVNNELGIEAVKEGSCFPACVMSVEDHGYILSLGIDGVQAFLPKAKAPENLKTGSLVDVAIEKVPHRSGAPALVTADQSVVRSALMQDWEGLNIGTLLPGALVNVRVRNVLSDGLLVSFLTFFSGTIDPFHIPPTTRREKHGASKENKRAKKGKKESIDAPQIEGMLSHQYEPEQRLKARILYVDVPSKRVGLTLLPHLLAAEVPVERYPPIGRVYETAEVLRVDPDLGVLLALEEEKSLDSIHGYAHISNVSDEHVEDVETRFRRGQIVRCRVVGSRPVDSLVAVSLKNSVVDATVLTTAEVVPGLKITGVLAKIDENMLLLQLTPHLKGIVPARHMSEAAGAKAYKKFRVGQRVSGRVLSVDREKNKVFVTLKQTLLDSKLPIITCMEDAIPGTRSHGVVFRVLEHGLLVKFYGGISGIIPQEETGLPSNQTLEDAFAAGQVVKCRVVDVDMKKSRLKLSIAGKKKRGDRDGTDSAQPSKLVEEGSFVRGIVTSIRRRRDGGEEGPASFVLDLFPSRTDADAGKDDVSESNADQIHMIADEKTTNTLGTALLDVNHLSDHPAAALALAEAIKIGTCLESLLVLQHLTSIGAVRVTRKQSLIDSVASHALPQRLSDLAEGVVVPGYVASVASDAVFVRFLGDLTGRAGLAQLSDTFVADPSAYFHVGQSVRAHIVHVDAEKDRFSLSLKRSLTAGNHDAKYLQSFFRDVESVYRFNLAHEAGAAEEEEDETAAMPMNDSDSADVPDDDGDGVHDEPAAAMTDWASDFVLGDIVKARVHGQREYGLLLDIPIQPDVVGLATPYHLPDGLSSYKEGAEVSVVVLDVNRKDGIVDVSLLPDLLQRAADAKKSSSEKVKEKENKAKKPKSKKSKKNSDHGDGQNDAEESQYAVGDRVAAKVLLSKPEEGYCIVSMPDSSGAMVWPWLGYAATGGFNASLEADAKSQPQAGDTMEVVIAMLSSGRTDGRLILHRYLPDLLASPSNMAKKADSKKTTNSKGPNADQVKSRRPKSGVVVSGKIVATHPLHIDVVSETGVRGRVYITEAEKWSSNAPLEGMKVGDEVKAVVLSRMSSTEGRRHGLLELSMRKDAMENLHTAPSPISWSHVREGDIMRGFVQEVRKSWLWIVFSPYVRGRAFLPDAVDTLEQCATASKHFRPGAIVYCSVRSIDPQKRSLDVTVLRNIDISAITTSLQSNGKALPDGGIHLGDGQAGHVGGLNADDMVMGTVHSFSGKSGVTISLGANGLGHVSLMNVHDMPVDNALKGFEVGQYVRARVIGPASGVGAVSKGHGSSKDNQSVAHWNLSLKPSQGGECVAHRKANIVRRTAMSQDIGFLHDGTKASDLRRGQRVHGYVKAVTSVGVFVWLTSKLDGRVKFRQLSEGFIEDPTKAFPDGQYVKGMVVEIDGSKIDVSLRKEKTMHGIENLTEGQIVRGIVRKVEKFGVFVQLEGLNLTGMAHVSELADGFVQDPGQLFKPNQGKFLPNDRFFVLFIGEGKILVYVHGALCKYVQMLHDRICIRL